MNMNTECIHLADDVFTKWKLWAEIVIDMKTWGLTFMYDGNHGCSFWRLSAWTLCIPVNMTSVCHWNTVNHDREYGVISQMKKERQVQTKGHTRFSLYDTAQA